MGMSSTVLNLQVDVGWEADLKMAITRREKGRWSHLDDRISRYGRPCADM